MKEKKKYLIYLSLFVLLFVITGCQKTEHTTSKNNDTKNFMEEVAKEIPAQAKLYVPLKSENKQSVYQVDLNQDKMKEAVILYQNNSDNKQIHILILKEESAKWVKLCDTALNASILDYFNLILQKDQSRIEIVAGQVQTAEDAKKQLELYHLENNTLQLDQTLTYEQIEFGDFLNKKDNSDCILLDGTIGTQQAAYLYHFEAGMLALKSQINLDAYAEHEHITTGNLSDGTKAVFIDSGVGAHSMLTEVVFPVDGNLKLLGATSDANYLKDVPLYSKDIDQDGVIEIAKTILPLAYEDAATAEIPTIAEYASVDKNGNRTQKKTFYINEGVNFEIEIPAELEKNVIIESEQNSLSIKNQATNQVLYQISWTKESEIPQNTVLVKKSSDFIFYHEQKDYVISDQVFHLLEENFN